jgi:lysophospholipid acyltransferase (LPLAT)-like uncharacterized protein
MRFIKYYYKIILRKFIFPTLGYILGMYLKFVFKTSTVHIEKHDEAKAYFNHLAPAIYAFWHGRLLMMATIHPPKYQMRVLSSKNDIGILADNCVRLFGITLIRGSKRNPNKPERNKGGSEALREMVRCLRQGYPIGITPDGPLGPAHKIDKGILMTSIISQKPIIPMTYSCKSGYQPKTWDRFLIPFPFTTLYFKLNKPIYPPENRDDENSIEAFSLTLETALNHDMLELDKLCGRIK